MAEEAADNLHPDPKQRKATRDNQEWKSLIDMLEEEFEEMHACFLEVTPETETERHARILRWIHSQKRAALCLSGGGIRSGTFALGVIQRLAQYQLLDRFHFLSTVSGGGYIGSWLTGWINRRGTTGVIDALRGVGKTPSAPEPRPIIHLREFANYLTPRLGTMSPDTWTLIAIYLRNLAIIWLVFIPLLVAALAVPRVYSTSLTSVNAAAPVVTPVGIYRWPMVVLPALALLLALWGLGFMARWQPRFTIQGAGVAQQKVADTQRNFVILCLIPLFLSCVLMTISWGWWAPVLLPWKLLLWFAIPVSMAAVHVLPSFAVGVIRRHATNGQRWLYIAVNAGAGLVAGFLIAYLAIEQFPAPTSQVNWYTALAPGLMMLSFALAVAILVGLTSRKTTDEDREWWARVAGVFMMASATWMALGLLVMFGPAILSDLWRQAPGWVASIGGAAGLVSLFGGKSDKTQAAPGVPVPQDWMSRIIRILIPLAAPLFIVLIIMLVAIATLHMINALARWDRMQPAPEWKAALFFLLAPAILALGIALAVNLNKFSLHAMYKLRLMRAYLGASNENRRPAPLTGFDPGDNILMHQMWPSPASLNLGQFDPPMHVVNVALNLVTGDNLAWQERKAQSFSISPLHCGNMELGYRSSSLYGGQGTTHIRHRTMPDEERSVPARDAISLPTAVTISGAAVSPNMGYHSSPAVTFLLTLFNLRLGSWLGNPSTPAGDKTFQKSDPTSALRPLVDEAIGRTDNKSPYVYLSDGGHFENLGLYEMVLRRCRHIVVIDAGCDPNCAFADLGNAIRKIRVDLGIPIRIEEELLISSRNNKPADPKMGKYCAIGTIEYGAVDPTGLDGRRVPDGILLYIKPSFYNREPVDIVNYATACDDFPHESTADQWFSETQFESYRALGEHVIQAIMEEPRSAAGLDGLFEAARSHIWRVNAFQQPDIEHIDQFNDQFGNRRLQINGRGFSAGAQIKFNDIVMADFRIIGGRRISLTPPPAAKPGQVTLKVENPNGDYVEKTFSFT